MTRGTNCLGLNPSNPLLLRGIYMAWGVVRFGGGNLKCARPTPEMNQDLAKPTLVQSPASYLSRIISFSIYLMLARMGPMMMM